MSLVEQRIDLNAFYVIESLGEDERKTGTSLYHDVIKRKCELKGHYSSLIKVFDKTDLMEALNKILRESQKGCHPLIHFECHGYRTGLMMASGQRIPWTEFLPYLLPINKACKVNLYLAVASCMGGHIQRLIQIDRPCPFRGFIGPMNEIGEIDLLTNFEAFYTELFNTADFDRAIECLRNSIHLSRAINPNYNHFSMEAFFDKVMSDELKRDRLDGKRSEMRVRAIAKNLMRNPKYKSYFRRKAKAIKFVKANYNSQMVRESWRALSGDSGRTDPPIPIRTDPPIPIRTDPPVLEV